MKSVTEFLRFLQLSNRSAGRSRRSGRQQIGNLWATEAMEERLLLTGEKDGIVDPVDEPVSTDFYFATFSSSQNTSQLQSALGATAVTPSPFVANGYNVQFGAAISEAEATTRFSSQAGFQSLYANVARQQSLRATPNDPLYVDQWHLSNTGQGGGTVGADANIEGAWDSVTGQGVTIGIVDDGLQTDHPDLAANVNTTIDFDFNFNDNDPSPDPNFDFHGTAVAGVAAGVGNNNLGVSGAAWDAELVGLRLIAGPTTDFVEAQALTHQLNVIDIYNNSWGPADNGAISNIGPQTLAALQQSATAGRNGLGNIHVWAGGNGGDLTDDNVNYDPYANSRFTIAVGALNNFGVRSVYSDPGAALVVTAPSNDLTANTLGITTTDLTGQNGYSANDYADDFGGTSSATPLVAGIIALMLEANPALTYRDVTDILARTSERVDPTSAGWSQNGAGLWVNHEYGFGGIDATAAVNAALTHTPLGPEQSFSTGTQIVNQAIPEAGGPAVTRTVAVSSADSISSLEYVEVVFNATHTFIGDLQIVLTSPSGTQSVLAEARLTDSQNGYNNFVFSTTRNWGESSEGNWTISVQDQQLLDTGTFNSFELRFYGTDLSPIVTETGGTSVADRGTLDTFDVVLPQAPSGDVVLDITSADTSEVTVDKPILTFTAANWNIPQTVTVAGVSDLVRDGDQQTDVRISVNVASSDVSYAAAKDVIVNVTSIDDDHNLPTKPVLTAPTSQPATVTPRFEWTQSDNAATYILSVKNVFTDTVVQFRNDLVLPRHTFGSPFVDGIYEATVQGVNVDGIAGPVSDPLLFAIGEPAIPVAPTFVAPGQGAIVTTNVPQIQWRATPGALDYELYFSAGGNVTRVTTRGTDIGGGVLAYVPSSPLPEGFNSVWVRGFNPFGDAGPWSKALGFTVDAFTAPGTPIITAPILTTTTNAFPTFRWIAEDATSYELWVNEMPGGQSSVVAPTRVIYVTNYLHTSYTHFAALNNARHRVWVRAVNAAGEKSQWSAFEEFTVDVPTPETPKMNELGVTADQTPTFTWDSASGSAYTNGTTFYLWVNNLTTGETRVILQDNIQDKSFTPSSPLPQGRYAAWVQAYNSVGRKSAWSDRMVVTIDQPAPGQTSMTGPVAAAGSANVETDMPQFTWTDTPDAATYELWVNHLDSNTVRIVHEKGLIGTSYTHGLALPQGKFRAWARAYNAAGEVGEWSAPINFTLDVPTPTQPTITGPATNAVGTVNDPTPLITWTVSLPAESYELQLENLLTGALVLEESGIPAEQFTVPITLPETSYRVRVRGVNSSAEVGEWSEWSTFRVDVPNATTPIAIGPIGTIGQNAVTFSWQHTSGNVEYEILVRDLLNQEMILYQNFTFQIDPTTNNAVVTLDVPNGTYRFWVRAFNNQGTASAWSNSLSFNVDNTLASRDSAVAPAESLVALTSLPRQLKVADDAVVEGDAVVSAAPPVAEATEEQHADVHVVEAVMAEFADPQAVLHGGLTDREVT